MPFVSIEPRLFSHGDGGHFSTFTDIEKKLILAHNVNFLQYFQKVNSYERPFSICTDLPRISWENGHHLDARKWDVLRPIKSIRLARTALKINRGMLAKSCASI